MDKNCKFCSEPIPDTRRSNSSYCSNDCYRREKSKRDNSAYAKTSSILKAIKRNEFLLSIFYPACTQNGVIPFHYLDSMGFNWGITTGETPHQNLILKNVGKYAYHLNTTDKTVQIWKLKGE